MGNGCFEDVIVLFRGDRLVLSINHWLPQLGEFRIDAVEGLLHLIHDFKEIIHGLLGCRDEVVDARGLPFELLDSRLNVLIHLDDSLLHKRLLHIIQAGHYPVVVLNDQLKRNDLSTIDVCLLE